MSTSDEPGSARVCPKGDRSHSCPLAALARRVFGWLGPYRPRPCEVLPLPPKDGHVTVVIPTWNAAALLRGCLASVAAQTLRPAAVIVVDNGSTDGTPEEARSWGWVSLVRLPSNLGYSGALAAVLPSVSSEYVAVLNNDARPAPSWLERLVRLLDGNPSLGCASPVAVSPDGSIDTAGDVITSAGFAYKRLFRRLAYVPPPRSLFVSPHGVASVYRTSALIEVGGWDGALHSQWDDVDIGLRLWLAGWDCTVDPETRVTHLQGATAGRAHRMREFLAARNESVVLGKTMPACLLIHMLPRRAVYLWLSLLSHLARGTCLPFLAGKFAAMLSLPRVVRMRRSVVRRRPFGRTQVEERWWSVWWGLSRVGGHRAPSAS